MNPGHDDDSPRQDADTASAVWDTPALSRRVMLCLIAVPLVHGIGQSLVFAILPAVARDLGIGDNGVGLIYALPAVAWSLITAWWGHRCDVWDRKPILLLSLLGFAASTFIFAGSAAAAYLGWISAGALWALILFSRLLYSALSSGALPAVQAYVIQVTPPPQRTRTIGRVTAAWNFGSMLGPGVIGLLAVFGVLTPLFAMAAVSLLIWLAVRAGVEPQAPEPRPAGVSARLSLFDPRIRTALIIGICASIAQSTLLQTLGYFFMDRMAVATADAPKVVGVALMVAAVATLFSQTVLVARFGSSPRGLERAGLCVTAAGFVCLALSPSVHAAWVATLVCGLGYGLVRPGNISHASQSVEAHEQGAVAGLNGALWSAGFIVSPLFALPLHRLDPRLPYLVATGFLMLGYWVAQRKKA